MTPSEERAFLAGWRYGVEETCRGHDALLHFAGAVIDFARTLAQGEEWLAQVEAVQQSNIEGLAAVGRLRRSGGLQALDLYRLERAL